MGVYHLTIPLYRQGVYHQTIPRRNFIEGSKETNCSMVGVYFAMSLTSILSSAMVTLGEEASCSGGATTLSTSPRHDMVLCKDETQQTCEKDFESLCPTGWNLCTPKQFNNRNTGWNYNWWQDGAGQPRGAIYCYYDYGEAAHYAIGYSNPVLNTDQQLNCNWASSRPGCEYWAGN